MVNLSKTNNHRIIESPVYFEIINKQKHYFPGDGKQHNFNLKNYEKFFINFIYLSIKFAWEDL